MCSRILGVLGFNVVPLAFTLTKHVVKNKTQKNLDFKNLAKKLILGHRVRDDGRITWWDGDATQRQQDGLALRDCRVAGVLPLAGLCARPRHHYF